MPTPTTQTDVFGITRQLKENTAYLVNVAFSKNNVIHKSILLNGFKSGEYSTLYNNSYEHPIPLSEVYFLEIVKELCPL